MNEPLALQPPGTKCLCVKSHRPLSVVFERHHIWPQEYDGPTVAANLVYICATAHNTTHAYLRAFIAANAVLTRSQLRLNLPKWNYPTAIQGYAYDLAVLGYNRITRGAL